jgi:hypothetical protein
LEVGKVRIFGIISLILLAAGTVVAMLLLNTPDSDHSSLHQSVRTAGQYLAIIHAIVVGLIIGSLIYNSNKNPRRVGKIAIALSVPGMLFWGFILIHPPMVGFEPGILAFILLFLVSAIILFIGGVASIEEVDN